jgi:hypothetical protein
MSTALEDLERRLQEALGMRVIGLKPIIRALTIAVVARGHVLLQGPPGLGKTLLSKSLAAGLGGIFRRVQGTADLMPSDIIGVHVFDTAKREFEFRPGPPCVFYCPSTCPSSPDYPVRLRGLGSYGSFFTNNRPLMSAHMISQ